MSEWKITVALIYNKHLYREGMKQIINSDSSLHLLTEGKTKADVFHIIKNDKPDVLIVDSHLINKRDLTKLSEVLHTSPKSEVILMADDIYSNPYFIKAINSNIKGFLLQDINDSSFIQAIKTVYQKRYWTHPQMSHYLMLVYRSLNKKLYVINRHIEIQRPLHTLTKREFEVLELLVKGCGNNEITARLKITDATVKTHIRNIFKKLHVSNRTQAVLLAIRNGWVDFNFESGTALTK